MVFVKREGVILEPTDYEFENQAVLNPTTVKEGKNIHMFYRAVRHGNHSTIGYCKLDGPLNVVERLDHPVLYPEHDYEKHGLEDPRVVKLGNTYYMFYVAYDGHNAMAALATSRDLVEWEKHGIVSPQMTYDYAEDYFRKARLKEKYFFYESYYKDRMGKDVMLWEKDCFIFPKRINGRIAFVHRILPDIQIAYVDRIEGLKDTENYWKPYLSKLGDNILLSSRHWYESRSIGGGAPPIETKHGWLLIYHGVEDAYSGRIYHAAVALLDKKDPQKMLGRLPNPLFSPQEEWERVGDVNNVVFPTGTAQFKDRLYIYYGAGDKVVAAASLDIDELLDELIHSEEYRRISSEINTTAGRILNLCRKESMSVSRLSKRLNKDPNVILMALGWLARDNKIQYLKKARKGITVKSIC